MASKVILVYKILCLLQISNGYMGVLFSENCPEICQCDQFITNCQYNDLTDLPNDIDTNVISLDLSCNNLEKFPNFKEFNMMEYLNISHNKLSTLVYTDFDGLVNLKQLDLSFNLFHDWKDIHSSTFLPVKKLTFLDLSSNPVRSVPQYSNHLFIQSLIILRLNNCSMKTIPANVFNRLTNLRELHLEDNPITSINETFQLNNLKFIDLARCHLNYIGANVFSGLMSLETLVLKQNFHLKKVMCNSASLLYLDLSECPLETVPKGQLNTVTTLDLSGNYFKIIISNSFIYYPNLITLNLSTNSINSLQEQSFRGLNDVKTIDLSYNKLRTISQKVFNPTNSLTRLNLSHNYINSLDFLSSSSLSQLDASYCEIYELNEFSLENMPNLIYLSLRRNFLTSLPDGINGKSLVYLDLSSCRIKSLTNQTFENMFSLRQINLAGNALVTVDPLYFPRAIAVNIHNNPWRCDCEKLKRMYDWLYTFSESQLDYLICDSPEKYEGKTWTEACLTEWTPPIKKDNLWWYSVGVVIVMIFAVFGIVILKKLTKMKEERLAAIEEARRLEEQEALRRMQRRQREMREEASRNAPDPRETQRPPSYNEALLLPRLDASQPSLAGSVHSIVSRQSARGSNSDLSKKSRTRRKRRRRRSELSDQRTYSRATQDSGSSDNNGQLNQRPTLESDF